MPNFLGRAIGKIDGLGRRVGLSAGRHQLRSAASQMLQSDNMAMRAAGHAFRGSGNISNAATIGLGTAATGFSVMGWRAGANKHPNHPIAGGVGGYLGHSAIWGAGAYGALAAFSKFRL